jgi:hypothetical protein
MKCYFFNWDRTWNCSLQARILVKCQIEHPTKRRIYLNLALECISESGLWVLLMRTGVGSWDWEGVEGNWFFVSEEAGSVLGTLEDVDAEEARWVRFWILFFLNRTPWYPEHSPCTKVLLMSQVRSPFTTSFNLSRAKCEWLGLRPVAWASSASLSSSSRWSASSCRNVSVLDWDVSAEM